MAKRDADFREAALRRSLKRAAPAPAIVPEDRIRSVRRALDDGLLWADEPTIAAALGLDTERLSSRLRRRLGL